MLTGKHAKYGAGVRPLQFKMEACSLLQQFYLRRVTIMGQIPHEIIFQSQRGQIFNIFSIEPK